MGICCCSLAGTVSCKYCHNNSDAIINNTLFYKTTTDYTKDIIKYEPDIQYWCHNCDALLTKYQKYCHNCGTAIKWSEN